MRAISRSQSRLPLALRMRQVALHLRLMRCHAALFIIKHIGAFVYIWHETALERELARMRHLIAAQCRLNFDKDQFSS